MPQSGKLLIFCECSVPVSTLLGGVIFGGLGLYLRGVSEDCPNPQGQEPDIYECGQKLRKYFDMHFWRGRTCAPPLDLVRVNHRDPVWGAWEQWFWGGGVRAGSRTPGGATGGGGHRLPNLKKIISGWENSLSFPLNTLHSRIILPVFLWDRLISGGQLGGGGLQVL